MGFWKELRRDIASGGKLTDREMYAMRAEEAEAKKDLLNALFLYEQAEEWEKAGNICLLMSRSSPPGHTDREDKMDSACQFYWKAKNFRKMREAYKESFLLYKWFGLSKDDVQFLGKGGELGTFVEDISALFPGPSLPSEKEQRAFYWLFTALFEAEEYSLATEVFVRFRKALYDRREGIIKILLQQGNEDKALDVASLLNNEKAFDRWEYLRMAELFIEAGANKAAAKPLSALYQLSMADFAPAGPDLHAATSDKGLYVSFAPLRSSLSHALSLAAISALVRTQPSRRRTLSSASSWRSWP